MKVTKIYETINPVNNESLLFLWDEGRHRVTAINRGVSSIPELIQSAERHENIWYTIIKENWQDWAWKFICDCDLGKIQPIWPEEEKACNDVCTCNILDLWNYGHNVGCAERKTK